MNDAYGNSMQLHSVEVDGDRSTLDNSGAPRGPYDVLTIEGDLYKYQWISLFN